VDLQFQEQVKKKTNLWNTYINSQNLNKYYFNNDDNVFFEIFNFRNIFYKVAITQIFDNETFVSSSSEAKRKKKDYTNIISVIILTDILLFSLLFPLWNLGDIAKGFAT